MATLARRVGLGLNARGDVAEFVRWADRARSLGLESVWIHDSYFERDAVTYASSASEVDTARHEHDAAQSVGLDVRWVDALDVPFPFHGGTLLPDQAQFDPMDVLEALVGQLHGHGGTVHEGRRVVSVSKHGRPRATLDDGSGS